MKTLLRIIVWGFAAIGLSTVLTFVGLIVLAFQAGTADTPKNFNLVVDLNQGVVDGAGGGVLDRLTLGRQAPLADVVLALDKAADDKAVKGLLVELGGARIGMAQAQELRSAVEQFRAAGKPAYAFSTDIGGLSSGTTAYYLATAFDQIWLQPSGGVGLTALALESPFLTGALAEIGIDPQFSRRHEYKSAPEMFTETAFTPEAKAELANLLTAWSEQIAMGVSRSRKFETARVKALIDGGPYLSQEALTLGLIDRLGYGDEVRTALEEATGTEDRIALDAYTKTGKLLGAAHLSQGGRTIALIHATGQVMRAGGPQTMDAGALSADLQAAADDPDIAAIVLRIDSPGGDYVAADTIWRAVMRAKEQKPVIASVGDMAASGGYFVAMAADKIVAQPGSLTGSIGVYAGKFVLSDLFDKLGVSWDRIETGPNAGMYSVTRPFTPEQKAKFERMLDAIYADFSGKAAQARGMTTEEIDRVARGRVFSGLDAKAGGLIDELGGIDTAVALAREAAAIPSDQTVTIRPYPDPNPFEALRKLFGSKTPVGVGVLIDGLVRLGVLADRIGAESSGHTVLLAPENYLR